MSSSENRQVSSCEEPSARSADAREQSTRGVRNRRPYTPDDRDRNTRVRRWGYFVHRHRWWVLSLSVLSFVASIAGLANGGQPKNHSDYNVESVKAANLESQQLPSTALGSSFVLLFTNSSLLDSDPRFESAVSDALARLRTDPRVTGIETPYQGGATAAELVSTDRHSVAVNVGLKGDFSSARRDFGQFRSEVQ